MKKIGVIVNNIGTPSSYHEEDVGLYLKEFLMDKEILRMPKMIRYFLVHAIIVPRRKKFSAEKYQKIWGKHKSPLLEITEDLTQKLQVYLNNPQKYQSDELTSHSSSDENSIYEIEIGMRYGEPSILMAIQKLIEKKCDSIVFLPMYPQFAKATVSSCVNDFNEKMSKVKFKFDSIKIIEPFYQNKDFIQLMSNKLKYEIEQGDYEHILFSFHGLPLNHLKEFKCYKFDERSQQCAGCINQKNADLGCYRAQCVQTAKNIAQYCKISEKHYTVCFQSRLGPTKWIGPSTEETLKKLSEQGVKKVVVQAPSFMTDCLETLEEINFELKEMFLAHGGLKFKMIDAPNSDDKTIELLASLARN